MESVMVNVGILGRFALQVYIDFFDVGHINTETFLDFLDFTVSIY